MPLATGSAVNGVTGSLALQGKDGVGILRYIPAATISTTITRGDSVIPLVNNVAYAVNKIKGSAMADISVDTYLYASLLNADFFNAAVGAVAGDVGTAGYNVVTIRSNNQGGEGPQTFARAKFAGMSGSVRFSNNGGAQAFRLGFRMTSVDPLSVGVVALGAPAAGALSLGGELGFAQASFAGATDVVAVSFNLDTGITVIPGNVAGTNSNFPSLPKGVMQTVQVGTVTITQIANPATLLGLSGANGTFVMSLGAVGAGVSMTFQVMPMSYSKPVETGIGYVSTTYALLSVDGVTAPFVVADL